MRTILIPFLLFGCSVPPTESPPAESANTAGQEHNHGHGGHRFDDADVWAERFENPARDEYQMPDRVLAELNLSPSAKVADIGAATGYFPVRFAAACPLGRVWGIDIEPDMVRYLNARARSEGLDNLFSVMCADDDALIPEPVDLIFLCDTYHHIGDRQAYFERLQNFLLPNGRVAIVDWRKESKMGPPREHKMTADEVRREMEAADYKLTGNYSFLPQQYFLVFAPAR